MTLEFQYGRGVCCLPQRVAQYLAQAPGEACRIVLYLASNPRMCRGIERKYKEIAAACGVTPQDVRSAVLYWMERGVLQQCTSSEEQTEEPLLQQDKEEPAHTPGAEPSALPVGSAPQKEKAAAKSHTNGRVPLPSYAAGEVSALLEQHRDLKALVDECQRQLGKMLSSYEITVLTGLYDALSLSPQYILSLLAYCKRRGKHSVRYLERTALSLLDEGVDTVQGVEEKIAAWDRAQDMTVQIRKLFGLGERALTAKEKTAVEQWANEWRVPMDMITYAYEATIHYTGKASIPYAASIIKSWHTAGITDLETAKRAEEQFQKQKEETNGKKQAQMSSKPTQRHSNEEKSVRRKTTSRRMGDFDVDEFLELALKRTFR